MFVRGHAAWTGAGSMRNVVVQGRQAVRWGGGSSAACSPAARLAPGLQRPSRPRPGTMHAA
eukprot:3749737-Prymnesium_polylepis.1